LYRGMSQTKRKKRRLLLNLRKSGKKAVLYCAPDKKKKKAEECAGKNSRRRGRESPSRPAKGKSIRGAEGIEPEEEKKKSAPVFMTLGKRIKRGELSAA